MKKCLLTLAVAITVIAGATAAPLPPLFVCSDGCSGPGPSGGDCRCSPKYQCDHDICLICH